MAADALLQGGQLDPIDLLVEERFHRAAPGGNGAVKAAGNYSPVRWVPHDVGLRCSAAAKATPRAGGSGVEGLRCCAVGAAGNYSLWSFRTCTGTDGSVGAASIGDFPRIAARCQRCYMTSGARCRSCRGCRRTPSGLGRVLGASGHSSGNRILNTTLSLPLSQVLRLQADAKRAGYSDVVYLDAKTDTYLEEVSSCNIFTVTGKTIRTPALRVRSGTGIRSRSVAVKASITYLEEASYCNVSPSAAAGFTSWRRACAQVCLNLVLLSCTPD